MLWLNLTKINEIYFLQSAHKQGNPSVYFHAPGQNVDTHANKQHRLSQNIFLVGSSFVLVIASDMHLEHESEKRAKIVHFHTTKNIQIQSTFSLFLDEFLYTDLRPIYCSLTCSHTLTFFLGNNTPFFDT